ncbi:hypothetical protein [Bacteroides acidifaciens]|jgi:hypothetical protein|uniref:hypothetical protein n=1 Tax=Bacteroides acidifaciens TaxID=85831 RepID=UPI00259A981A|nr:hypothetical protein [Bacteroides acidifaciens]
MSLLALWLLGKLARKRSNMPDMKDVDFDKPFVIETTMEKWNDIVSFNQLFLSNFFLEGKAMLNGRLNLHSCVW